MTHVVDAHLQLKTIFGESSGSTEYAGIVDKNVQLVMFLFETIVENWRLKSS